MFWHLFYQARIINLPDYLNLEAIEDGWATTAAHSLDISLQVDNSFVAYRCFYPDQITKCQENIVLPEFVISFNHHRYFWTFIAKILLYKGKQGSYYLYSNHYGKEFSYP